jgi:hypothetical protein
MRERERNATRKHRCEAPGCGEVADGCVRVKSVWICPGCIEHAKAAIRSREARRGPSHMTADVRWVMLHPEIQ